MRAKSFTTLTILAAGMLLASCAGNPSSSASSSTASSSASTSGASTASSSTSSGSSTSSSSSASSATSEASSTTEDSSSSSATSLSGSQEYDDGDFQIATSDGSFNVTDGTVTILSAGTYEMTGTFEGMITGDLGDDDVVELDLLGVTLTNSSDSVIKFFNADKLKISAKKDTENVITDSRSQIETEDDSQGSAAIYAECDLNIIGKGSLTVTGGYNNGIHTKDDLEIKNLTLDVTAPNNALKGNDSVTIESGTISVTSTYGDGIKTTNSDVSDSGNQRGTVEILGGTVDISACYDAVDAAYDVNVSEEDSSVPTTLTIETNSYRSSSSSKSALVTRGFGPGGTGSGGDSGGGFPGEDSSESSEESAKGLKADNQIVISGGTLDISAYDDAIHANNDETLENGESPLGNITISGGTLTLVAADDGLHADGTLLVSGGDVTVEESYEGIEANVINITGGETAAYASNDAANAGSQLNVTGGYLFGAVSASGDVDAIDSNGSITVNGGVLIGCGPNSDMAGAVDADGSVTVKSGTLMAFGYANVTSSSVTSSTKSGTYGGKAYTVKFSGGSSITTDTLPSGSYSYCRAWSSLGSISSIS